MRNVYFFLIFTMIAASLQAQTGGSYDLSHNVIASGGGTTSSGDNFVLDGTIGQSIAGTRSTGTPAGGNQQSLFGGFWTPRPLQPTAASVNISGRVYTASGQAISNAIISFININGSVRVVRTSSFGYYRFENVLVGQTYMLTVASKRFLFANPNRVITVNDEVTDVDFVAQDP